MKKVIVLMAALMIFAVPSFAQKDKTIKKGDNKKESIKPRKDKKEGFDRIVEFNPQEMEKKHDKMLNMKKEILCKELRLEEGVKDKFWDTYKMYDAEMFKTELIMAELQHKVLSQNPKAFKEQNVMFLTEDEAKIIFDKGLEMEKLRWEITQNYLMKFQEIIKIQGVLKLKEAEKKFEQTQLMIDARDKERKDKLFSQPTLKKNK